LEDSQETAGKHRCFDPGACPDVTLYLDSPV
jgi:hypothetical protein